MRISDWSSDVCSSDLGPAILAPRHGIGEGCIEAFAYGGGDKKELQILRQFRQNLIGEIVREMAALPAKGGEGLAFILFRSEARRVGKECVSTCKSRWATYH